MIIINSRTGARVISAGGRGPGEFCFAGDQEGCLGWRIFKGDDFGSIFNQTN